MLSNRYKQKFYIKTLGCKTNQIESEQIASRLVSHGFDRVFDVAEAGFYILNSCSVTQNADDKSLALLCAMKQAHPEIKTVLTGCFAQLNSKQLAGCEFIDYIAGNDDKFNLPLLISEHRTHAVSDIFSVKIFNNQLVERIIRTRATLKIQDGCNNRCSYCTIPFARGNSRSNTITNISRQVEDFLSNGYQEIVLTGIHIGQWGSDFEDRMTLIDLLKIFDELNVPRYRLGSLNVAEIDDKLIEFLSQSKGFCPHFHISLQNTLDKTLSKMNRYYSFDATKILVEKLNKTFSNPFLGSDFIVGFPSETEEDFRQSMNNLSLLELSQVHVFPYSKRPGTPAAQIPCSFNNKDKQKRAKVAREIASNLYRTFAEKNIDTVQQVIIQSTNEKKSGKSLGLSRNYLNILVGNKNLKKNTIHKLIINGFDGKNFSGEIVL